MHGNKLVRVWPSVHPLCHTLAQLARRDKMTINMFFSGLNGSLWVCLRTWLFHYRWALTSSVQGGLGLQTSHNLSEAGGLRLRFFQGLEVKAILVWVKIRPPGIGPQVLVFGSIYQGNPFWVPIFDPQPYGHVVRSASALRARRIPRTPKADP